MDSKISFWRRLGIGLGSVAFFLLVVVGGLGLVVLLIWPWWVAAAVAAAALALALPMVLLFRVVTGRRAGWSPWRSYAKFTVASFLAVSAVVAFPIYYLAYLVDARPTLMPLVTLTDGKKTVQFQGMQHVGSETFYKSVVHDLREALAEGYTLYDEGVQPVDGRPDLTTWFDALATDGGGDLTAASRAVAEGCGMHFQLDDFTGLTKDFPVRPERHVAADVDYLDLRTEYDRLMHEDPAFAKAMAGQDKTKGAATSDPFESFLGLWQAGTPEQERVLGLACRGFFSRAYSQKAETSERDKLIVDFRNERLAKRIAEARDEKIYVTYGAKHIPGVIADLQALDPNWHVVATKWTPAIANPEMRKGDL